MNKKSHIDNTDDFATQIDNIDKAIRLCPDYELVKRQIDYIERFSPNKENYIKVIVSTDGTGE